MAWKPFPSVDVAYGAGLEQQEREYYLRLILAKYPERELDSDLVYGNPKLEYFRLYNEGLIDGSRRPPVEYGTVTVMRNEHGSTLYMNGVEI